MSRACQKTTMKKTICLAALLACPCTPASAASTLAVSKLQGSVQINSAERQFLLKTGEALPKNLPAASIHITVLEGWVELNIGLAMLRTEAGASCTLSVSDSGYSVQNQPASSPIQLTDSCGNVAVVTEKSSFEAVQAKRQLSYKSGTGKTLLTTNDGETHIMKTGDKETVNCDTLQQQQVPPPYAPQELAQSTAAAAQVSTAAAPAEMPTAVSSATAPVPHKQKPQKETAK